MSSKILKGNGGPTLVFSGGLSEDRYGLSTGTARWWALQERALTRVAQLRSTHPLYSSLKCERREISEAPAGFFLDAFYSGLIGNPSPIYEIDTAASQEPIDTHPNFASFAGTSDTTSLNGAIFEKVAVAGGGEKEVFRNFGATAPAEFKGVTSYYIPVVIARKTYISKTNPTTEAAKVGTIDTPPFVSGGVGTWLMTGLSSEQRGEVYVVRVEWKASGPRGWSTTIYP